MKLSLCIQTPEFSQPLPVALLSGAFEEKLEKAARLGYDGVELLPVRPEQLDPAELRAALRHAGLAAVAVSSAGLRLFGGLTLLDPDPAVAAAARRSLFDLIELAAALDAPVVTVGSFKGWLRSAAAGAQARGELVTCLHLAGARARPAGIRIAVEALNRYESDLANTAEDTLTLVQEVGHPNVGVLLDTYHMNIEERDPAGALRATAAAGRLYHVHIADSNRLPPGCGHIDFARIVLALHAAGYHEYLSAELLPQPDPDSAARLTVEHMRPLIPRQSRDGGARPPERTL